MVLSDLGSQPIYVERSQVISASFRPSLLVYSTMLAMIDGDSCIGMRLSTCSFRDSAPEYPWRRVVRDLTGQWHGTEKANTSYTPS